MNINKENDTSYFNNVMQCKNVNEVVNKTDQFIQNFDPVMPETQKQIVQVKNHLKGRAKEASGQTKTQVQAEIKKVENISRALVFYKKIEKEYGKDLAETYVKGYCQGQVLSSANKKEIETRCREGIVIRTYEIPPEKVPNQSRRQLVFQYNQVALQKLQGTYGFEEVKLAMQRSYSASDRREMKRGDRAVDQNVLEKEIVNNRSLKQEVKSSVEKFLNKEHDNDRVSGEGLSFLIDLAMKDDKVKANYLKHGIKSSITTLSVVLNM